MILLSERTLYGEYIYPESSKYSDYEYFYKNFSHDHFNLHDNFLTELGMSVWLFCCVWKIIGYSFHFLATFLSQICSSGLKNAMILKKLSKTAKNSPFFYKNNETSSLSLKKNRCFSRRLILVLKHLKIWCIKNKINL